MEPKAKQSAHGAALAHFAVIIALGKKCVEQSTEDENTARAMDGLEAARVELERAVVHGK